VGLDDHNHRSDRIYERRNSVTGEAIYLQTHGSMGYGHQKKPRKKTGHTPVRGGVRRERDTFYAVDSRSLSQNAREKNPRRKRTERLPRTNWPGKRQKTFRQRPPVAIAPSAAKGDMALGKTRGREHKINANRAKRYSTYRKAATDDSSISSPH